MSTFESSTAKPQPPRPASEAERILSTYTHDEQRIILHNLESTAATTQYLGQDFVMKVLLNQPGAGWHWNFSRNEVRVDPETLLKAPLDVSRAIFCHEGLHRRITPKDGVPAEDWSKPGMPFLVNSIEDPRIENFGGEAYPAYVPIRDASYRYFADEKRNKAENAAIEKVGRVPLHVQAGLALIDKWFREVQGLELAIDESLDPRVRAFVEKALPHAQNAWWRYPTKTEADWQPVTIAEYFKEAYSIIRSEIWPSFQELYEHDRKEQLLSETVAGLRGADSQRVGGTQGQSEAPLSEDEARSLLDAARKGHITLGDAYDTAQDRATPRRTVDLSQISPELRQEIEDFFSTLPDQVKEKLQAQADRALGEASQSAADELEGKASQESRQIADANKADETAAKVDAAPVPVDSAPFAGVDMADLRRHVSISLEEQARIAEEFAHLLNEDRGLYQNTVREVSPVINELESSLRSIFLDRRKSHRETGRRSGPTQNINRYIRERASGKPAVETRSFEVKTRPVEKDYAVLLLVDVSGSMRGKIHDTFAATVACIEALSRLEIAHAVMGFNEKVYSYKSFKKREHNEQKIARIESAVTTPAANYNNDGWALTRAYAELARQPQQERILIVFSDGVPEPSSKYAGEKYDLAAVAGGIEASRKVSLVGLGVGPGTDHVAQYYVNHSANIPIDNLADTLAMVVREAIKK
jgi:uncharacterized protein with von Willebrand factor type A (vWA) domain